MPGMIAELVLRQKELSLAAILEKHFSLYVRYVDDVYLTWLTRTQLND